MDLVAEFIESQGEELKPVENMDGKLVGMVSQQGPSPWEVYVDGASNQKGSGVGLVDRKSTRLNSSHRP